MISSLGKGSSFVHRLSPVGSPWFLQTIFGTKQNAFPLHIWFSPFLFCLTGSKWGRGQLTWCLARGDQTDDLTESEQIEGIRRSLQVKYLLLVVDLWVGENLRTGADPRQRDTDPKISGLPCMGDPSLEFTSFFSCSSGLFGGSLVLKRKSLS